MDQKLKFQALKSIRDWNCEDVLKLLTNNDLKECCDAFKRREINGELLLDLTEGKLALWKRDLSFNNIRKLSTFLKNLNENPQQFLSTNIPNNNGLWSSMDFSIPPAAVNNCTREILSNKQRSCSPNEELSSWGSDFDDDDEEILEDHNTGKNNRNEDCQTHISSQPNRSTKKESLNVDTDRSQPIQNGKPPVPIRPPNLIKPSSVERSELPKPPAIIGDSFGSVQSIVSALYIPSENLDFGESQYYEEFYESIDSDNIPRESDMKFLPKPPPDLPPKPPPVLGSASNSRSVSPIQRRISPIPPNIPNSEPKLPMPDVTQTSSVTCERRMSFLHSLVSQKQKCEGSTCSSNSNDAYDSSMEQYEMVEGNQNDFFSNNEYYLEPVKSSVVNSTSVPMGTPPLPPKLQPKPLDPELPMGASNSSKKIEESPPSSGDGSVGKISGLFKNFIHRPPSLRSSFSKEKAQTPEISKPLNVTSTNVKPLGEQRTFQNNQRPLPPTPELKSAQRNSILSRRISLKCDLMQMPWYHPVDRRKGEDLVRNGEDGFFIVRPSSQTTNPLTLTLWYNKRVYNICIRHRPDGRYALGTEKAEEQSFSSVEEMVMYFKNEKLVLFSGGEKTGQVLLTSSPRRDPLP